MLFEKLNDEAQRIARVTEYTDGFVDKVCNLYDIEIPDLKNRDSADLLKYAFLTGMSALVKYEDGYAIGSATYGGGKLTVDGRMDSVIVRFANGTTVTVPVTDCAVFEWNNIRKNAKLQADRYASMLSDIDCSLTFNINYSKVCPIPIVDNDLDKRSLTDIIDNIFKGSRHIFKRSTYKFDGGSGVDMLQLTSPEVSNYISNLSSIHDELIQRWCLEVGICIDTKDKKAQVNNDETTAFVDYASLCSKSHTRQLDKFVTECKNNLGIEVTVTPSPFVWIDEDIEQIETVDVNDVENGGIDNGNLRNEQEAENN